MALCTTLGFSGEISGEIFLLSSPRSQPGRPGVQRGGRLRLLPGGERLLDWGPAGEGQLAVAGRGPLDLAGLAATSGGRWGGLSGDNERW